MSSTHVVDDLASRTGSASSLIRTVVGVSLRECGGWLSTAALVALMRAVGVDAAATRTGLSRVKGKGLLVAEARAGRAGYALSAGGEALLQRGDRRIFTQRSMGDGAAWCLISFGIPETQRSVRHQLRQRLLWIGAGNVSAALWIVPGSLRDEVEAIVTELQLDGLVTLFTATEPQQSGLTPAQLAARWWDLTAIRELHDTFIDEHRDALEQCRADTPPEQLFRFWVRALDAWRPIPYLDPGLPTEMLPGDWPGGRSGELFRALHETTQQPVREFLAHTVARAH